MKYYAVIDTNVVVSSFLKEGSIPNQVVNLALNGQIVPVLNEDILKEYKTVLLRNEFGLTDEKVEKFISRLTEKAVFLDRTKTDEAFKDLSDVVFYEIVLTVRTNKDGYLVTGNKKDFPDKPFVVTPREMLDIIYKNQEK